MSRRSPKPRVLRVAAFLLLAIFRALLIFSRSVGFRRALQGVTVIAINERRRFARHKVSRHRLIALNVRSGRERELQTWQDFGAEYAENRDGFRATVV